MTELAGITWTDVERLADDNSILLIPVGATEQHGPHLPVSTDTDIAEAIAGAAARRRTGAVVAPPVAYGSSGEHAGFAGTLSIGLEVTELLLVELCRSASATFRRILLISTHGGNAAAVTAAVAALRAERRDVRAWGPHWDGDAHAGRTETSLMLAINPGSVRQDRAVAGATAPVAELLPRLRAQGVQVLSPSGVLGNPAGASAAEGHALLELAGDGVDSLLDAWSAR
ncbi:MAG: mftE [Frankiales bacterium]|nr:mftE [Frankiales bacterium]